MMDTWKNQGKLPKDVPASEMAHFANGRARNLYEDYQNRLVALNAADFGDLLLLCIKLFREHRDRRGVPPALQVHPRRRVSGQQRRPVHVAAAAGAGKTSV